MEERLERARAALDAAETLAREISAELDDPEGDLDDIEQRLEEALTARDDARAELERLERIAAVRVETPLPEQPPAAERSAQTSSGHINYANAAGTMREELTYSPDIPERSFFRDLVTSRQGDYEAAERLRRHQQQVDTEYRDLSTTATAGGGFVPPIPLFSLYAEGLRAGRPFANALGAQPLPSAGMSITLPRITTNPTAAVQATEGSNIDETDLVEATVTTPVVTIAGQQDVSIQLLERSDPGIDMVLFRELADAYDTTLDNQLLNGTGSNGQHTGLTTVTSTNDVTYTDGDPVAAELIGHMYDALQQIHTNRFRPGDMWIMHPRRSAWLAAGLSSTFPLFQQGGAAVQNIGGQDNGLVLNSQGLRLVNDPNVVTTAGASTTEDEVYAVRSSDLILYEDNLRARVHQEVLDIGLEVRLQVFAYSAFISERFPAGISVISGSGLIAPTFGADTTP